MKRRVRAEIGRREPRQLGRGTEGRAEHGLGAAHRLWSDPHRLRRGRPSSRRSMSVLCEARTREGRVKQGGTTKRNALVLDETLIEGVFCCVDSVLRTTIPEKEKKIMKKKNFAALALAGLLALSVTACGGDSGETTTIKVGATPAPHAEVLEVVKPLLEEQGITLEIVEFNDYNTPNDSVEDGSIDANYFQHITYMNNYNETSGTHLVSVAEVHYEPFGLYAGKCASIGELPDGAQIAVPNDATNEARALLLLQQEGLITLNEDAGINATILDIVDNPKNLEIVELEAAQIPSRLADVDLAVINGNYAIDAGLKVADALAIESADGEAATAYVNVLTVKEGNEDNEAIQALVKALCSDEVKTFMEETYEGAVVPMF